MFHIVVRLIPTKPARQIMAGLLLVLILLSFAPSSLSLAQEGNTEVLLAQKAGPAVVFIETVGRETELRRRLRAKNRVSELSFSTPAFRFSAVPVGSYGFITPKYLGMALITRSPDLPFEAVSPTPNSFEIHKLADGTGMLVGFVEAQLKPQLTSSQRPKNVRLGLYSNPSGKAPHIVALPLAKLLVDRMPTRLDPKEPGSAVLFEVDLQGTADSASR
ncbi:MAG: hypothetical protein HXY51_01820 [Nitrospirae bacterium]|nr:hypothetical protein [Nitrospirota bacterium]